MPAVLNPVKRTLNKVWCYIDNRKHDFERRLKHYTENKPSYYERDAYEIYTEGYIDALRDIMRDIDEGRIGG